MDCVMMITRQVQVHMTAYKTHIKTNNKFGNARVKLDCVGDRRDDDDAKSIRKTFSHAHA